MVFTLKGWELSDQGIALVFGGIALVLRRGIALVFRGGIALGDGLSSRWGSKAPARLTMAEESAWV